MGVQWTKWIALGSAAGALLAIAFSKGGGIPWGAIAFLGLVGACLGAIGGAIVRFAQPRIQSRTNVAALAGSLIGAIGGIPVGAFSGLGRPMLAIFNQDLPPQDYEAAFGGIGGAFVGASLGALAGAGVGWIKGRREEPPT